MALAVVFGLPESLPSHKRSQGGLRNTLVTLSKLVRHRTFVGYSFAQALVFAAMFGYISGSPFVLQEIFGVSPQTFSVIFCGKWTWDYFGQPVECPAVHSSR